MPRLRGPEAADKITGRATRQRRLLLRRRIAERIRPDRWAGDPVAVVERFRRRRMERRPKDDLITAQQQRRAEYLRETGRPPDAPVTESNR